MFVTFGSEDQKVSDWPDLYSYDRYGGFSELPLDDG